MAAMMNPFFNNLHNFILERFNELRIETLNNLLDDFTSFRVFAKIYEKMLYIISDVFGWIYSVQ